MKLLNLSYLILISLFSTMALANIEYCYYNGDDFYVLSDGIKYRQDVDDNFSGTVYDCDRNLAALYDGDDLYVFNDQTKSFQRQSADDNFLYAKIAVTNITVGLYDGDDFYIYSASSKSFRSQGVDDSFTGAAMVGTNAGIIFYDGDDLYSYCNENFNRSGYVDDGLKAISGRFGITVGHEHFLLTPDCHIKKI